MYGKCKRWLCGHSSYGAVNCLRTVKDWSAVVPCLAPALSTARLRVCARAPSRMSKQRVPRSASIEEMDLFASNSHLEEANGAATTPFGISIKREPDADLEQTAVTKRVRFALPVAPVDEEDVDEDVVQLCGINGCLPRSEPTPHAPRPTPDHARTRSRHAPHAADHPPPTHPRTVRRPHTATAHARPSPTLPPSRPRPPPRACRCPLRWNHPGICSVQSLPSRTRRVRNEAKPPVEPCSRECHCSPPGPPAAGSPQTPGCATHSG